MKILAKHFGLAVGP